MINPITQHQLKTALVYDRVNTSFGGAEQVLLSLLKLFPDAPIYTSVYDPQEAAWAKEQKVIPSFLQKFPGAAKHHRSYLPLMPLAFEQLDLSEYELVISVTSAEAKGIITNTNQVHLCYLLTPPRYLYSHQEQYQQSRASLNWPIIKNIYSWLIKYLSWWDQVAIHRPDMIIPLSEKVRDRVKKYYELDTLDPIYPPIDAVSLVTADTKLEKFNLPANYNLVVSRLVAYKNVDLAIKACQELQQPLVIVGSGPELKNLKKIARSSPNSQIIFLGNQPQPVVNSLMNQAKLFLSPAEDDFGLAPLQANLFGTPAIINQHSGVAEVFHSPDQGVLMKQETVQSLIQAITNTGSLEFDPDKMKEFAHQLSQDKFLSHFRNVIKPIINQKLGIKL